MSAFIQPPPHVNNNNNNNGGGNGSANNGNGGSSNYHYHHHHHHHQQPHQHHPIAPPSPQELPYSSFSSSKYSSNQPYSSDRRYRYGPGMDSLLDAIESAPTLPTPGAFAGKMVNTLPPITYNLPPPSPPHSNSPSTSPPQYQHHPYERRNSVSFPSLSLPLPIQSTSQPSSSTAMSISSLLDSSPAPLSPPKEPMSCMTPTEYSVASILVNNPTSYSSSASRSTAFTPYSSSISSISSISSSTSSSSTSSNSSNSSHYSSHSNKRKYSDSYSYEEERASKIRRSIRDHLGNYVGGNHFGGNHSMSPMPNMPNDLPSPQQSPRPSPPPMSQMTTITCYHAAVAQKSYGSEKRFLCPPPVVTMTGPAPSADRYTSERPQLSMSVVCETSDRNLNLEQKITFDDSMKGSFKYLHVTGTAKAKHFYLKLKMYGGKQSMPFAVFDSNPINIISKPSKKTAKARNVSSCILSNSPVSLFNRINSQTVRTKYMSIEAGQLCAKNSSWSSFTISVVDRSSSPSPVMSPSSPSWKRRSLSPLPTVSPSSNPITYGTEIILTDTETGISSDILIIRKVEKGHIARLAFGPVSQMQKVALQRVGPKSTDPVTYLSAAGVSADIADRGAAETAAVTNANAFLRYQPSRLGRAQARPGSSDGEDAVMGDTVEEVDDYLCWTIVGISKFEYTYFEALSPNSGSASPSSAFQQPTNYPITPFPMLTTCPVYKLAAHALELTVSNFFSDAHQQQPMEIWLGDHGPLTSRTVRRSTPIAPSSSPGSTMQLKSPGSSSYATYEATSLVVDLPSTQVVVSCNHDRLMPSGLSGRALELPILFVRSDGVVYHSGKACNVYVDGHGDKWSVKNVA